MKKIQLLSIFTFLLISSSYAQTECDCDEKDAFIADQTHKISKLEGEIKYYKEALNLLNSNMKEEANDFIVKINSARGNKANKTVTVEGLLENKGEVRNTVNTTEHLSLMYDPKGNGHKPKSINFGKQTHIKDFQKGLPVSFTMIYTGIEEEMPTITNLTISLADRSGREAGTMIFKSIPVSWF